MTFCVNGARFEPEQYYRDDDQARDILWKCRENPVLLTGLRRIGKSWFLRRFAQIFQARATRHFAEDGTPSERPLDTGLPAGVTLLDAGSEDFESQLKAFLSQKDHTQVLAIDELEKLAADPSRIHLLDPLLSYRPLLLAAAPSIHELAQRFAPILADFFERGCVSAVLGPLRSAERRALMLQTCDPGEGVSPASTGMTLWRDWGGHPLVLQQVGELARRNPKLKYNALVNLVHAALNGAPRYGYSLCDTGLTSAQREALIKVAVGAAPPGDDPTAAELHAHGAIIPRKLKNWVIENIVLQRYFEGLTALPQATEQAQAISPKPAVRASRSSAPIRVFSWIHLSDLHFGAGSRKHHFHQEAVMRAICKDIAANAPKPVNRLFVTGDIAFSAQSTEYKKAREWFGEVTKAAGVPLAQLRVVPGNHDVDRSLARKALARCAHHAVRSGHLDLDDLLADSDARGALTAKLASYRSFVEDDLSGHPTGTNGVDWFEPIPAVPGGHGPIRIAGLSSVWVSDELDGKSEDKSRDALLRNLVLAAGPLAQTIAPTEEGTLLFVLTHHPQEWMPKESADLLYREITPHLHIHLCGHVHDPDAVTLVRFGASGQSSIRLVAGAAHGDASEEHGYAWGALQYIDNERGARWQIGWAPRGFSEKRSEMRPESKEHDLDAEGFAWRDLDCPWPAPGG